MLLTVRFVVGKDSMKMAILRGHVLYVTPAGSHFHCLFIDLFQYYP
jgi:hypothetical protein